MICPRCENDTANYTVPGNLIVCENCSAFYSDIEAYGKELGKKRPAIKTYGIYTFIISGGLALIFFKWHFTNATFIVIPKVFGFSNGNMYFWNVTIPNALFILGIAFSILALAGIWVYRRKYGRNN